MHQDITSAPQVAPRFSSTQRSKAARPAVWRRLDLAALMTCAIGCAVSPPARDATREIAVHGQAGEELVANAAASSTERPKPIASASADPDGSVGGSDRSQGSGLGGSLGKAASGRLPWLDPTHVGAAVRARRSDFQACQALGDVLSQRSDGAVTVGWAVRASGSVHQVTLGASTFRNDRINACVLDVARQVTFPPSAAPTQVSWTVQFRGAQHEPLADATLR